SVLTQESGLQFVEEMQKHAEIDRWSCELMMRRKNGDPFWVRVSANTIRDAGWKPLGLVLVTTDIMHLKELDRMKTEFVSMVSHELRTPLTSIKGYVSMLREGELGEMTREQHEFLDITLENADRLMGLINDLLDISRIESGRLRLALSDFDFSDVIKAVRSEMRAMGETKQIKTVVEGDASPVRVRADRDRVVQILANLLSNAYKYSPVGTTVRIRTQVDQPFVRIQVVDQGMGLSEQDQAKLFTKFFRTEAAKQRGISGTGLGLSISRQLVEMQGGEMSVRSEIGHGSTFAFTLPLAESAHAS
ncbi:MAG: ATP-binding protein, partial [Xanthomonadales bacterium]|nr:ATP-binding protein [Xanthomonadales bacterium]